MSNRNSVTRFALSGPWQVKHLSEKIGRISRLNSMIEGAEIIPEGHESTENIAAFKTTIVLRVWKSKIAWLLTVSLTTTKQQLSCHSQNNPRITDTPGHPFAVKELEQGYRIFSGDVSEVLELSDVNLRTLLLVISQ